MLLIDDLFYLILLSPPSFEFTPQNFVFSLPSLILAP